MITIEQVRDAMMGEGINFQTTYYPELEDCVEELIRYIKKRAPGGLTKTMIEKQGYKNFKDCLKTAPTTNTDFGNIVLEAWIKYFFEYPEIMEFVGIIAEQENPKADKNVITEMRNLKIGEIVLKPKENKPLSGLHLVFTGASLYFSGEAMERFLEKCGAITSHSVTSKTEILITGERPAAIKIKKAKSLGIKIINEEDFYKKCGLKSLLPWKR